MRRETIVAALFALSVLIGRPSLAQTGPIPAGRPPEWGIEAGYGFAVHLNQGPSNEHEFLLSPSVGFRLSSRLEFLGGATFERYFTPEGYYIGVLPIGARLSIGNGKLLPFATLGAGFGWTDLTELFEISRRFNYRLQASMGIRGAVTERSAWVFEARFIHTSNAGSAYPNHGLNSLVLLAGWRFR